MVNFKRTVILNKLELIRQIGYANFATPKWPFKITFALTYKCNLRCLYCKIWERPSRKELELENIKKFLLSINYLRWVHLTGGEIFLRNDIEEILNFLIEKSNLSILTFPTNGILTKKISFNSDFCNSFFQLKKPIKKYSIKSLLENRYFKLMKIYINKHRTPIPCGALKTSCFIDPYGDIYPCLSFATSLGNIKHASYNFKYLWQRMNNVKKNIRRKINRYQCPGCWTSCEAYPTILSQLL